MRLYQLKTDGAGLEGLTLIERSEPQPAPDQILVRMRAASLNFRDLMIATGTYGLPPGTTLVPLSDGAGDVVAVGSGVTRVQVGDRVAGIFMQTYLEGPLTPAKDNSALGGSIDGVLSEYVALHENGVVIIPEHLTYEEAATLPCAAVTAWHGLVTFGKLKAGETVLLQGTGGVSLFGLQFAKMSGARVIITSSSNEKLERARKMGADDLINYKETPEWGERVKELTAGAGANHVVEVGGAGTMNQSLNALAIGGKMALIGGLSGMGGEVNTPNILRKNLTVQGIYVGSREMFEAMNRAISQQKLRPVIDRVFPFEDAKGAYEHLQSGKHFGKIVIQLNG